MGRELKRVALDFDWPLHRTWPGYCNPWYLACEKCDGSGCDECNEDGVAKGAQPFYDAWTEIEPPTGEGYQIWETVSEGSPISPVFATPEVLARYMENATRGKWNETPYETWLAFITGPGSAPSMVIDSDGVHSGVEGIVKAHEVNR